jgi:hypothetical protein
MAMFSQKKSFFKGKLFYVILFGLFVFGIWLNQEPVKGNLPNDVSTDIKYPVSTDDALSTESQDEDYNILDNIIGRKHKDTLEVSENAIKNDNEIDNHQNSNTDYYLVKEVNGVVKIFYYDEQGKETLIRDTDIAFSLLSMADQELFRQGVRKNNIEELDELLQDFDS